MADANRRWLVMLYLSGDNNLSADMVTAINDIAQVGLPDDLAVTIQYDPAAPYLPTFRYNLVPGRQKPPLVPQLTPLPLRSLAVPKKKAENAASPAVLRDFIVGSLKAVQGHGFSNRMLVLSGHGSGAIGDFLTDNNVPEQQLNSLSIPRLQDALRLAKQEAVEAHLCAANEPLVHVLGMDSCLMSMGEVCLEVQCAVTRTKVNGYEKVEIDPKNTLVEYLVGSEGYLPNAGWPYGALFEQFKKKVRDGAAVTPEAMSGYLVRDVLDYYRSYIAANVSVDMSACHLDKLRAVTDSLRILTERLERNLDDPRVQEMVLHAHWRCQSFKFEQYVDLGDFCAELRTCVARRAADLAHARNAVRSAVAMKVGGDREASVLVDTANTPAEATANEIVAACDGVEQAIADTIGSRQGSIGVDSQYATGLSIYFPWQLPAVPPEFRKPGAADNAFPALKDYVKLRFPAESGWARFLSKYLAATMRQPKNVDGKTVETLIAQAAERVGGAAHHKIAPDDNRIAPDDNRIAPDDNRFLIQMFGGRLPWSMANPPQQVKIPVEGDIAADVDRSVQLAIEAEMQAV